MASVVLTQDGVALLKVRKGVYRIRRDAESDFFYEDFGDDVLDESFCLKVEIRKEDEKGAVVYDSVIDNDDLSTEKIGLDAGKYVLVVTHLDEEGAHENYTTDDILDGEDALDARCPDCPGHVSRVFKVK